PYQKGEAIMSEALPISEATRRILQELAEQTGQSVQDILDRAGEDYRRKGFFQSLAADYAALRADPREWEEELAERKLWEGTLMDGLDPKERWSEEGHPLPDEGAPT